MSLPMPAGEPAHALDPSLHARPTLRASGPAEILQLIPYLIGFHPERSVVIVAMRGKAVVVSARYDLDAPPAMAEPLCRAATEAGATGALLAIYDDTISGHPLAHRDYYEAMAQLFDAYGLNEVDALAIGGDRWWSYRCADSTCCPPEGTLMQIAGRLAAGAVAEGLVALPGRADLEAELEPDDDGMLAVLDALAAYGNEIEDRSALDIRADDWAAVRRFVKDARGGSGPPSAEQSARVLWALKDVSVRDASIGYLTDRPEPEVQAAWRDLARVAPPFWRPPAAAIYAMWCLAGGGGARCNVGIDAALKADPEYSLALLLGDVVMSGMQPFEFIGALAPSCRKVGRRIQRKRSPWGRQGGPQ